MKKLKQDIRISYKSTIDIEIEYIDISMAAINEQGEISSYIPVIYSLRDINEENDLEKIKIQEKEDIDNCVQDFLKRMVHYQWKHKTSILETI